MQITRNICSVILFSAVVAASGMQSSEENSEQIKTTLANGQTSEVLQTSNSNIELLDPTVDYMFKQIFGNKESKGILIGFLNALFQNNPEVKNVELGNVEISKIMETDKSSRLDIKATCDKNIEVDIEMQCKNTGEIPERAFHYLANMVPSTLKERDTYGKVKVISIWILNENVTNRKNVISEAKMCFLPNPPDNYNIMTDKARIFFIELERFDIKNGDKSKPIDAWLHFLKQPGTVLTSGFPEVNGIKEAVQRLKELSGNEQIREEYETRRKTINDQISSLVAAEQKGAYDKAIETAKKMLSDGLGMELVAKYSGLPISEIQALNSGNT